MKSIIFKFFSLFSVIRLYNILAIAIAQYLTSIFILGHKENILDVILDPYLFAIILCSSIAIASGYIINNFYDYEKDIINRPIRSSIDKTIRKRTKLNLYFSLLYIIEFNSREKSSTFFPHFKESGGKLCSLEKVTFSQILWNAGKSTTFFPATELNHIQ